MFDQIFGNYLVKANKITKEQFKDVIAAEKNSRIKLGLIAVSEKLMTIQQADEVNRLQAIMDKRFGDIAVEKGYLTDLQVSNLLKKQGNVYLAFAQTLIDKGYMTLEEIDKSLEQYQEEFGFTHSDMDDLLSGDVDRTVKCFLPENDPLVDKLSAIAIRTILRIIDSGVYVSKAYFVDEVHEDYAALQKLTGKYEFITMFAGLNRSLLNLAGSFAKEEFEQVDLDALDSVGEFINCVNGLFASEMGNEGIDLEMLPPQYYEKINQVKGSSICVFPVYMSDGTRIDLIIASNTSITVA